MAHWVYIYLLVFAEIKFNTLYFSFYTLFYTFYFNTLYFILLYIFFGSITLNLRAPKPHELKVNIYAEKIK